MEISFLGDVHGRFNEYKELYASVPLLYQLGDMGIGFNERKDKEFPNIPNHYFIRGNHDNPNKVNNFPGYLGNFGISNHGLFFVSGALSIDRAFRILGKNYWDDEQLNYEQMNNAVELYHQTKPDFVISHDAPESIYYKVCPDAHKIPSSTSKGLDFMFNIHQPKYWFMGHFHKNIVFEFQNTIFRVIDTMNIFNFNI
ncbi:MAG: metallophosphoesterase [Nanoarchaeota archaeon]